MKVDAFAFDYVNLSYYQRHKINPNWDGSDIYYPDWIKNKKATINPTNKKDNEWFQYFAPFELNHEKIGKSLERITKIKFFINKYNWERINFSIKTRWLEINWQKLWNNCY